jgi:uncharacterized membrane protein
MATDGKSISQSTDGSGSSPCGSDRRRRGQRHRRGGLAALRRYAAQVHFQPHAPDFSKIAEAPLVIRVHLFAALTALAIGTALMMRVKGTGLHKLLGWTWVLAMGTTAVSSLFIRVIDPGHFSFIHLLSGWTIVGLPGAVYAIKRGKVGVHRRAMTGMFVGGLLLAGLFTLIPGRLLWTVFLG